MTNLEENKLVRTVWILAALLFLTGFFILLVSGCDSTDASVYKAKYEEQLQINDSLQIKYQEVLDKVNLIFFLANQKVDSLKLIESNLRFIISTFSCDTTAILHNHFKDYDKYLWIPLNNRLNYIIDSLNRR